MAKPRATHYPEPEPGSVAAILRELIRRDGRSMRAVSLAAGLAGDACRNALRNAAAQPRPKTLAALATALGVDVRVLLGQVAIPENVTRPASDDKSAALPTPFGKPIIYDPKAKLRDAVRDAMKAAMAVGMPAKTALFDTVLTAMLAAVESGLEVAEATHMIGAIGTQEYSWK